MHPKPSIWRTLAAGLAGGAAFVLGTFLTFAQLAGSRRGEQGLLFDPDTQHEKVITVWKQLEPLPRVLETPAIILVGMVGFGIAYAFVPVGRLGVAGGIHRLDRGRPNAPGREILCSPDHPSGGPRSVAPCFTVRYRVGLAR